MKFVRSRLLAAGIAALLAPAMVVASEPPAKIVAFNASVKVDVDATGKPVRVEAPSDLPQAIRTYIEKRVASWQYEPAKQDGVPVTATTYVQVAACAIPTPSGDAFSLAADFDGNGPRKAGDRPMPTPKYPGEALRRGYGAEFVVIVDVGVDGNASLGTIEKADVPRKTRAAEFEQELRRWAKTLRFDPEMVAGRPVAGQVRIPVSFGASTGSEWRAWRDEYLAKISASRECQMARGDSATPPVAIDSVVKVTPTPAS